MEIHQLPLIIVAAFWAAFSGVTSAFTTINERRDSILHGHHGSHAITLEHRYAIFYNDWCPMKLGIALSCLTFAVVIVSMPELVKAEFQEQAVWLCRLVALVPFSAFLGFFCLGIRDFRFIRRILAAERDAAKGVPPPAPTSGKQSRGLAVPLLLTASGITAYWANFYTAGHVQVTKAEYYVKFERAFLLADAWLAISAVVAAHAVWKTTPQAALLCAVAGSSLVFLGLMDIAFNLQNGLYALLPQSAEMAGEVAINFWTMGFGGHLLRVAWDAHGSSPSAIPVSIRGS